MPQEIPVEILPGSEDIVDYVFASNLAAQEAVGDMAASQSVERVDNLLAGSPQLASTLHYVEGCGWVLCSFPLVEDTTVVEVDITLEPDLQPLPGEDYAPEEEAAFVRLLHCARELPLSHELGRGRQWAHMWFFEPGAAARDALLLGEGLKKVSVEVQGYVPIPDVGVAEVAAEVAKLGGGLAGGLAGALPEALAGGLASGLELVVLKDFEYCPTTEALIPLLEEASRDIAYGFSAHEVESWSPQRLRDLREHYAEIHTEVMTAVFMQAGRAVGMSQISRAVGSIDQIAEQGTTVVRHDVRGKGVGLKLKRAALVAARERWGIERVYTSNEERNLAARKLNQRLGFQEISRASGWELRLQ